MKNRYVVRKTTKLGNYLYLHPSWGFCVEMCNGGVYTFTNKKTASKACVYANKYLGSYDTLKDEVLTYDEYLSEREKKHDVMEHYANEHGVGTHREDGKLYLYLTGERFGKPVAMWYDATLHTLTDIESYVAPCGKQ